MSSVPPGAAAAGAGASSWKGAAGGGWSAQRARKPASAEHLKIRSDLMIRLTKLIEARRLTQARAARLFGVTQPRISDLVRGPQRHIIDAVLAGRDCIGVMPTGAGKSLTFQIPAKLLPGPVLVISPLISLMKDQVDALTRLGFNATVLNSTVDFEERRKRLGALRRGEIELVYVAPEGLEGSLRPILADCGPSLVVVDEAHCISHWGHDFRPAYRRLRGLKSECGDIPVLAQGYLFGRPGPVESLRVTAETDAI